MEEWEKKMERKKRDKRKMKKKQKRIGLTLTAYDEDDDCYEGTRQSCEK
jgi:hypothetical protein